MNAQAIPVRTPAPPRPRFAAQCIRHDRSPSLYGPSGEHPFVVWLNIPGYRCALVSCATYTEARAAAEGALFCGAPYVAIDWIEGRTAHEQVWVAEAAS